jgi:lipid-A-disaccharide synthase
LLRVRRKLRRFIESAKPDAVVLCDWGGFNTPLLPDFKQLQLPVLYYFPPRSWQQQGDGGLSIVPYVDRVATPFEWSAKRLQDAGANAEWVGHPLLETVAPPDVRDTVRQELGVGVDDKLVALLPGSRSLELNYIAPHLAAAAQTVRAQHATDGNIHFVAAVPPGRSAMTRRYFPEWVSIVEGTTLNVLRACDAAIVKSGTVTLEAAVADAPQVVVYDVPLLLRAQVDLTGLRKKVPLVAMPNIILGRMAAKELLGEQCRPPQIVQALSELLHDVEVRRRLRADYAVVRRALGSELPYTATQRTASMLDEMLCGTSAPAVASPHHG